MPNTNTNSTATVVIKVKQDGSSNAVDAAKKGVSGLSGEVKGLTGNLGDLKTVLTSALDSSGGGMLGRLAGLGGGIAMLAAVGSVIGQAMRMGYEFERISTKAALQLRVGTPEGPLSALSRVKAEAANAGVIGGRRVFDESQMAEAMGALGAASGTTVAIRSAKGMARYAMQYGMTPTEVAQTIGPSMATTGQGFDASAAAMFGGAENAGPFGRRLQEFIGTATAAIARLQVGQPGRDVTVGEGASWTAGIARLGGYYGTAAGVQAMQGAQIGLTQGGATDPARALLMKRAGISDRDIILGGYDQNSGRKIFTELLKEYGNVRGGGGRGVNNAYFDEALVGMVGQDNARTLIGGYEKGWTKQSDSTALKPPISEAELLKEALAMPFTHMEVDLANIREEMIKYGDAADTNITAVVDKIGEGNVLLGIIAAGAMLSGGRGLLNGLGILSKMGGMSFMGGGGGLTVGSVAAGMAAALGILVTKGDQGPNYLPGVLSDTGAGTLSKDEITALMAGGNGRVYGIGTYASDTNYDLTHMYGGQRGYTMPGMDGRAHRRLGMTKNERFAMQDLVNLGYDIGLTTTSSGNHDLNSQHYFGNAADIGTINGKRVGASGTEGLVEQMIMRLLSSDPQARVGTAGAVYKYLMGTQYADRVFKDGTDHVHVEGGDGELPDIGAGPTTGQQIKVSQASKKLPSGQTVHVATYARVTPAPNSSKKPTSGSRTGGHSTPATPNPSVNF